MQIPRTDNGESREHPLTEGQTDRWYQMRYLSTSVSNMYMADKNNMKGSVHLRGRPLIILGGGHGADFRERNFFFFGDPPNGIFYFGGPLDGIFFFSATLRTNFFFRFAPRPPR